MARTDQQAFLDAYLGGGISANRSKVKSAGSTGAAAMKAGANTSLPSLYDFTDDAAQVGMAYVEAAQKQQEAAAKAAQQAAKEAENASEQMIKDNIQNMRDVAKMNRDKKKRVQKIADNMASSETATLASAKKKTGILPNVLPGLTEASPYVSPYDSLGRPNLIGDGKFVPVLQRTNESTMNYTGVPARSVSKTAAVQEWESPYAGMTTKEKLAMREMLEDAASRGTEAEKLQVQKSLAQLEQDLSADEGYLSLKQKEINSTPVGERVAKYSAQGYQMDNLEEKDAKKIVSEYAENHPGALWEEYATANPITAERVMNGDVGPLTFGLFGGKYKGQDVEEIYADYKKMSDAEKEEARNVSLLGVKVENGGAIEAGALSALPAFDTAADYAVRNTQEYLGLGDGLNPSDYMDAVRDQSPVAYAAGNIGGTLASYAAGSQLVGAIPGVGAGLQSAGQAIGGTRAAQLASKAPVIGKAFTPEAITGILGDQLVDTVLDTGAGAASSIAQGDKSGAEIAADAAKNFGTNLAFNIGSAAVLGTAGDVLNRWKANRAVPSLEDDAANQAVNMGAGYEPPPSLYDYADNAAKAVDNNSSFSLDGYIDGVPGAANDVPLPSLENAVQAAQGGADDVVNAWRSGTLTNAQLETLKPGGVNRAAFEQATGVKLPDTSSETRRVLRGVSPEQTKIGTVDNLSGFADVVDDVFNGKASFNKTIVIGQTPDVYQSLGASPLNITIEPSTLYKIAYPEGYLNGKHNLGIPALKMLPVQIDNPVAILKSKTQPNSFIILTEWVDTQGRPVIIPLHLDKNGAISVENKVASAYGHNHVSSLLGENNQNVLWTKGNEDIDQLLSHRLQLPQAVVDDTLVSNYSIPTLERNVNAQQIPSLEPDMSAGTVAGNAPPSLYDGLPESIGAMRHNPRSYAGMQVEYGTIAPGENAARVVDVPISTDGTDRVSASARTFMEAPQTTDELVGMFEKGVEDGLFSHDVKRDADSLAKAVSAIEQDGYQNILTSWKNLMRTGASLNKEQIVQGQLLYTLAAKNGDTATAMELAGDLARIATEAGQNLQAQRLLKRMTPEGKLYYAQQTVDSFNRQLKQQLGDGFQDIKIPEELVRPLMEATDAKAQNDAMQNIYQYVADQLPTDWGTRWNAWRYLAMLSNPATHVRNVLSNAVNVPARKFKNILGAGIERLTLEEGQRTKSIINPLSASDRDLVKFAKNDIENVMPQLTGAQKYSDRSAIKQMVDPFKVNGTWGKNADSGILAKGARRAADAVSGGLSSVYKFNSWALGAEDMLFKKGAYVDSLSQYLKANGIDPAKATQKQLDAAREYAVEEALRATYTEFNSLAQAIGKLERTNLGTKVFIGGTVPFKSTPLNIIRRGVRYSPVGLMESVTNGVRRLRAGEINANQFIDNISQGLSGTAILGLGMWLGANGIINGISPENKKEQSLKSSQGWQNYSINLPGGGTYTIDWGGPSVMAILAGVETAKAFEQDGYGINEALTALGNITEPMFDTTMLDGVNSAIQSATYAGSNPVTALASQAASNFVTQAIPSLSGVVARAYDPIRRTTYSDKEGASGAIDESKQRIMNKVPGASTGNQPYIDVWGREQENPGGSFVGRLAYGLLSPGYYSPDRSTVADDVVEGLYEATGDSGTLPGSFNSSVTVDGEKIKLSPENYTLAKQTKGKASQQMIESLYDYPQYNAMDAEVQADVVKGVYDLANDVAKYQAIPSLYDELVSDIESGDASKSEMLAAMYFTGGAEQVIPYLVADELTSDVRADKNTKGNSIPGSREKNFIETLMQNGYTRGDAEALYQLLK